MKLRHARITPAADEGHARLSQRTVHQWQERLGIADQPSNDVAPPQLERELRCPQEPFDPTRRIRSQIGGTLERTDRNTERPTGASSSSSPDELARGFFVSTDH